LAVLNNGSGYRKAGKPSYADVREFQKEIRDLKEFSDSRFKSWVDSQLK